MPQTTIQPDSSQTNSPGFLDSLLGAAKAFKENLQARFAPQEPGQRQIQAGPFSVLGQRNDQLQAAQPQQSYSYLQQNAPQLAQPFLSHSQSPYGSNPGEKRIDTTGMIGGLSGVKRSPGL